MCQLSELVAFNLCQRPLVVQCWSVSILQSPVLAMHPLPNLCVLESPRITPQSHGLVSHPHFWQPRSQSHRPNAHLPYHLDI